MNDRRKRIISGNDDRFIMQLFGRLKMCHSWLESMWYSNCDKYLPNGLYCGFSELSTKNNIFRRNNFVYKSNNEYYKDRLPPIKSSDIIILSYDSNNGILSFGKENDDGKLTAQIYNLPKGNTY